MLTDFARDHLFTIAWFGLMAMVWFGWGQEDPPNSWRWRLGVGSGVGVLLAGVFGFSLVRRWSEPSVMEGRYAWFGVLVLVEVVAAGTGCFYLWRSGRKRWMAWWVAVVVAAHFIPLAFILDDTSLLILGAIELLALAVVHRTLRSRDETTSRLVGPVMGTSLLAFALISVVVFIARYGAPWSG